MNATYLLLIGTLLPAFEATMKPVDTSGLMGSPEAVLPYDFEPAFPALTFNRPLAFTHAGDGSGRLFVVEQDGVVRVFPGRADAKPADVKPFLDLTAVVDRRGNEQGLLGLAFEPRFKETGRFYVFYSHKDRASVLSRFRVARGDAGRADRASEEVLLRLPKDYTIHNGGSIEFGPDGMLYVGVGDGGSHRDADGMAQNLSSLHGKVLRLDVSGEKGYAVPKDNPFAGKDKARGEVWAYGLRNPWRLSFDPKTGALWTGDVGEGDAEEVNVIARGGNYGWNLREGRAPLGREGGEARPGLTEPVWAYPHAAGRAIVGGGVYRGKRLPALDGAYLFADYIYGDLWALWYDGKTVTRHARLSARERHGVTAFGTDAAGEPHFTAFDGRVYRLREAAWKDELKRPFPAKLSATGLFTDLRRLTPAEGLIPYEVNVPLWSDHAEKERLIALPAKGRVEFSEKGHWGFPKGTVFVKTFLLDLTRGDPATRQRLETRLLVRHGWGWEGYTYLWDGDRTEARLHLSGKDRPLAVREKSDGYAGTQTWHFPSRQECKGCHTRTSEYVLGMNTRQMNRPGEGGENQIARFNRLGVFSSDVPDPKRLERYPDWGGEPEWDDHAALTVRARAYLDSNCAHCHAPGGTANMSKPDFRFHTPAALMNVVGEPPERGKMGPAGSKLVAAGDPLRSELWLRVKTTGPPRMPMLASSVPDHKAVGVLKAWIEGMRRP